MKQKFDLFSVNERIMLIMKEKKMNKNSLSKALGLSQPALKKIEEKQNLPSFKLLFEIISVFSDISAEWLVNGKGSMLKNSVSTVPEEVHDTALTVVETMKNRIIDLESQLREKDKQVSDLIAINRHLLERETGGHELPNSANEDRLTG